MDVIKLLPDAVANQIAAGEVIQRPASAVKELLENSIDAGATEIILVVKDAGRTLIQVTDNGKGMTETDARLCFERHATSKISLATDLFSIRTMGFRGEAMASIAAVAHVEMKTRPADAELGTRIVIEGSEVKTQEPCTCPAGTQISIKNLFFNIPARRNFLKSNQVELRHIMDEFNRVAMAFPSCGFRFIHNEQELFHLEPSGLRQRINGLMGGSFNERLVPVEESTDLVSLDGFIGKPEFARKTRGEQFFFVNQRFIRSPYLHHAVSEAFEDLLPADAHPGYFIFLEVDPSLIDINIHPTKTEIKFEDERSIYAILRSAVKRSLGKYHVAPTLDFETESSFDIPFGHQQEIRQPTIRVNTEYNPFLNQQKNNEKHWEKLMPGNFSEQEAGVPEEVKRQESLDGFNANNAGTAPQYIQLQQGYFLSTIRSGLVVIDQHRAHERVLYERFLEAISEQRTVSQQQLFPQTIMIGTQELILLEQLFPALRSAGFDIDRFGNDTIVVNGCPAGCEDADIKSMLEEILENYRKEKEKPTLAIPELLARSLAQKLSIKRNKKLSREEMNHLADELFACSAPYVAISGKPTLIRIPAEELDRRFHR